ncbi:hypothetical protein MHYP_G00317560 [Metynnis hypsauchen]
MAPSIQSGWALLWGYALSVWSGVGGNSQSGTQEEDVHLPVSFSEKAPGWDVAVLLLQGYDNWQQEQLLIVRT